MKYAKHTRKRKSVIIFLNTIASKGLLNFHPIYIHEINPLNPHILVTLCTFKPTNSRFAKSSNYLQNWLDEDFLLRITNLLSFQIPRPFLQKAQDGGFAQLELDRPFGPLEPDSVLFTFSAI